MSEIRRRKPLLPPHSAAGYNFATGTMTTAKGSKLLRYVEHRIRVTVQDGRTLIGTFLAFDKHLNLVLSDTEEYRMLTSRKQGSLLNVVEERQEKRLLGLIILRGENVVSIAVEGPPPVEQRAKVVMPAGVAPGVSKGVGRGMPMNMGQQQMPPMGLGSAVPGVGAGGFPPPPPPGMGRGFPPPQMR